jgi:hypothetical protein
MSIRAKSSLIIAIVAVAVTFSCGKKDSETTGGTPVVAAPPPLPAGASQNLTRNSAAPFYNFDNLGPINYPAVQKSIQVSGDSDIGVTGWALDVSKKGPAGGVDIVLDNVPHSARYGMDRADVAAHFNRPDYAKCGFQLTIAKGQLPKGQHSVSVRVISSDQKSYNEGPVVQFTLN